MTINVMGAEYRIEFKKLKDRHGDVDYQTRTIRINALDDPQQQSLTLTHEVLHASLFESGLLFVEKLEGLDEALVRCMENGLKSANLIKEVNFDELETNNRMERTT